MGKRSLQNYGNAQYMDCFCLIFIMIFFFFVSKPYISNYANSNTLDVFGLNLEEVKNVLRTDFDEVTEWLYDNYITPNAEKCHFMCLEKDTSN